MPVINYMLPNASYTPAPYTIPISGEDGKISTEWLKASQTPAPNTIPVAGPDGKLADGWLNIQTGLETYSRLTVATSFPTSPNHNDLVWREDQLKLYKYNARTNQWKEIDWQTIVMASPEWVAGWLRINSSSGKLEISPNGSNWYECIPAVGNNSIELATVDNTSFSYKYWIAPGQKVILRNVNHIPIVFSRPVMFDLNIRCETYVANEFGLVVISNTATTTNYTEIYNNAGSTGTGTGIFNGHRVEFAGNNSPGIAMATLIVDTSNRAQSVGVGQDGTFPWLHIYGNYSSIGGGYWIGTIRSHSTLTLLNCTFISVVRRV